MSAWLNVNVQYWRLSSLLIAVAVLLPVAVIFSSWLQPTGDVWKHLVETVLGDILLNSLILVIGVSIGTLILGTALAWLTAMCEFPGRRFFEWALMLPLAVPAYVLAFVVVGLFDYSGSVATWLRETAGLRLPEIRSASGVVLVMVLAFYPYVYMLARTAFQSQGRNLIDSGRILGLGPWDAFYRIALPMARPALAAGVALAVMESLADFGAVAVFNFDTFTTAIYKAWLGMFNLQAAAQLASVLLLFVMLMLYGERRLRNRARFTASGKTAKDLRYHLSGKHAWLATATCLFVLAIAFIIPVGQLLSWVVETGAVDFDSRYFSFLGNTLMLGVAAALAAAFIALMLAYTYRLKPDRFTLITLRISTMGYALPGSVLAVGIMLVAVWFDKTLVSVANKLFGLELSQLITGTVLVLIIAYVVRFLAVAHSPIDSAFERIRPSILQAARSLGAGNWQILWRVSMPMLRSGILSAMLLVFVEVMKEMPATLLLRPFGWDTLATRIFEMTSEGEWERAALPAVTLILAGLIPVAFLVRRSEQQ
ncbi:MAG: iron ABC transporter permease [Proteobacteria bacterium]|nr:iron ABC transporter permease [Pseudomonadota bacterium]